MIVIALVSFFTDSFLSHLISSFFNIFIILAFKEYLIGSKHQDHINKKQTNIYLKNIKCISFL